MRFSQMSREDILEAASSRLQGTTVDQVCVDMGWPGEEARRLVKTIRWPSWESIDDKEAVCILQKALPFHDSLCGFCKANDWPYQKVYRRIRDLGFTAAARPSLVFLGAGRVEL